MQDEAAAYKAAADAQLERAQTIITNVDAWYGAIPVDADLGVFPDTSFSPALPSLCDPDVDTSCVLPGSNMPEIFGAMKDDLGGQLGEDLAALNAELARELNATANAIVDAVPNPPPYNPSFHPTAFTWRVDEGEVYGWSASPMDVSLGHGEHTFHMFSQYNGWYGATVSREDIRRECCSRVLHTAQWEF
jgi:hypothetical protein